MRFLVDCRELNLLKQPTEFAFAAFVRSLTPEQQSALGELLELVEQDEAFRLF